MRDRLRVRHYSIRTEQRHLDWVRRYVRFHGLRHPSELGADAVEQMHDEYARAGEAQRTTHDFRVTAHQ